MQSSFWYIRVFSNQYPICSDGLTTDFFFGCSKLFSEWLWFESFLATACPTNKYGWDCTKTCFCKNSLHCNRYTGPTDKCECKDGYFNPPFCQAGNPHFFQNFPYQIFLIIFCTKKKKIGKKIWLGMCSGQPISAVCKIGEPRYWHSNRMFELRLWKILKYILHEEYLIWFLLYNTVSNRQLYQFCEGIIEIRHFSLSVFSHWEDRRAA